MSAEDLNENIAKKLDGICLTDHWLIKEKQINPFNNHIRVFYGVEMDCLLGDILAYGIPALPLRKRNLTADYIIKFIHSRGGIAVCAHPFSNRHAGFDKYVYDYEFDALEVNGSLNEVYQKKAIEAAEKMGIPVIGGSDAHSVRQMNTIATEFEISIETIQDIIKAIKNRDCKIVKL
ncbi:MAG: PHP-associated domain-containing protein [Promethearchaeota archaeon]